jgi:hypothetical protein
MDLEENLNVAFVETEWYNDDFFRASIVERFIHFEPTKILYIFGLNYNINTLRQECDLMLFFEDSHQEISNFRKILEFIRMLN